MGYTVHGYETFQWNSKGSTYKARSLFTEVPGATLIPSADMPSFKQVPRPFYTHSDHAPLPLNTALNQNEWFKVVSQMS